jgi:hypothetical protein
VQLVEQNGQLISYDAWQKEDGSINHAILIMDEDNNYAVKFGRSLTLVQLPDFKLVDDFRITES